jgi:hypothetical protein
MDELKVRLKSFIWRAGGFSVIAVAAYLANIGDIREVDLMKIVTIFVVTISAFVVNEGTKYLNKTFGNPQEGPQ